MSSHHFVKEGQEPALFIVQALSRSLIEPLLEWAPLVVVADSALDDVLDWGIKIDAVITRPESATESHQKISDQLPVDVVLYESDAGLLPTAFAYMVQRHQQAANVISETSTPLFSLIQRYPLAITILDTTIRWTFYSAGSFEKWLPASTIVNVQKEHADQPIRMDNIKEADNSMSVIADGFVRVYSATSFWIGEAL